MFRAVITGIGVASPFGVGWDAWSQGLRAGTSATRCVSLFDPEIPFPLAPHIEALSCHVVAEVPGFSPADWLGPKDLDRVPRVVPLALCATREALHSAGLSDMNHTDKGETGVVVGSGGGGWSFGEAQLTAWLLKSTKRVSPYSISSSIVGMVSSEISIAEGLRARSHSISDGCTSSSDAFGYALDLIRSGREKRLLVGGADGCITPAMLAGFALMRAIPTHWNSEPGRASRPFSADRDGFVLGEGAWMFVVEEREAALRRGARIRAELCGYGATCEAYHRVALKEPDEAARAMTMALADANIAPSEVDYVNLHGTATAANDPLETAAVKIALGTYAMQTPMSSTKSQIGHAQGASGAAGVAATIAGMEGGFIPPTINLDKPDPACDLDYVPHQSRPGHIEWALANCLGFGSKNAALVLRRSET
ncbi:3-oxoacyl-[acyl-carrier-protein] synthase 2 [Abditibacteriota bacterium]|nr:3-oxoacyl-[acyl-carrier-protein] synthase 2 [Abditibacteriota bacterium]